MRYGRATLCALFLFSILIPVVSGAPEPRMGPGFVYDEVNERCILVSGARDTGHGWSDYGDMWVLEDGVWTELSVTGIPTSNNFEMAYSGDDEKVVVFTNNNDRTYVYDVAENRWRMLSHRDGPRRRCDAGFCYDPVNGVFIMYGGLTDDSVDIRVLDDTWAYDAVSDTWTEMSPAGGPPRTYGCRMVWDSVNEVMLLWGGNLYQGEGDKLDDWWVYDYQSDTWTMIETDPKPPMRYWQYMAFDPGVGKVVMFGGNPRLGSSLGDTWLYDYASNEWSEVKPAVSPPASQCGAMVYVPGLGGVVLFGGMDNNQNELGEIWLFDAEAGEWSRVESGAPEPVEDESGPRIPGFPIISVIIALIIFLSYTWISGEKHLAQ
jgi:hypothetical protein